VLSKKFKTYYAAWDDYTGHHHEFGIKMATRFSARGADTLTADLFSGLFLC